MAVSWLLVCQSPIELAIRLTYSLRARSTHWQSGLQSFDLQAFKLQVLGIDLEFIAECNVTRWIGGEHCD